MPTERNDQVGPDQREGELNRRYLARERRKVIGLIILAFLILAIAFLRFGRTIPWGAR